MPARTQRRRDMGPAFAPTSSSASLHRRNLPPGLRNSPGRNLPVVIVPVRVRVRPPLRVGPRMRRGVPEFLFRRRLAGLKRLSTQLHVHLFHVLREAAADVLSDRLLLLKLLLDALHLALDLRRRFL